MKVSIKKFHDKFERIIEIFNLLFFIVAVTIWLYLTIGAIVTRPFHFGLLWEAFNQMYSQFSFKLGCITFISFNALNTVREISSQYKDLLESTQHIGTIKRFFKSLISIK